MAYVSIYEHPAFQALNPSLSRSKRAAIARRRLVHGMGQSDGSDGSIVDAASSALSDLFGGGGGDSSSTDTSGASSDGTSQQQAATQVVYGGTTGTDTGAAGGTSSGGGTGLTIPGPEGQGVQTVNPPPDVKPVIPPGGLPTPTGLAAVPTWAWIGGALVLLIGGVMVAHHAAQPNPRRRRRRRNWNPRANPMRRMHHRRR